MPAATGGVIFVRTEEYWSKREAIAAKCGEDGVEEQRLIDLLHKEEVKKCQQQLLSQQ